MGNGSQCSGLTHAVVLAAVCAILFFLPLAQSPFFNKGEPREALVVQDIILHGEWLFPLKMEREIPSKPPLFHWSAAVASLAFGKMTEATVRFPSAFYATLGVMLLYLLGRKIYSPHVGFLSALILATSLGYQSAAVEARVDMTLTFFLMTTLMIFYALSQRLLQEELWYYIFFFLLGLSVLAKGPVSLVLAGMIAVAFITIQRRWELLRRLSLHPGLLLGVAVFALWYGGAVWKGGGEFFGLQIIKENFARFFVYGEGGTGHQKPPYYYIPYLFTEGLPWTLFLPFVIIDWFKEKSLSRERALFWAIWIGAVFVFFSLAAGKRAVYILPLYPPLALLTALWIGQSESKTQTRTGAFKIVGWVSLVMGLLSLLPVLGVGLGEGPFWFLPRLGISLKPNDQEQIALIEKTLRGQEWFWVVFVVLTALLWFSAARSLLVMNGRGVAVRFALISCVAGLFTQGLIIPSIAESKSYKSFMIGIDNEMNREKALYLYGTDWDYTSVMFYGGGRVKIFTGDRETLLRTLRETADYYIMAERDWKELVASKEIALRPELRSHGAGPEGRDPLVLLRAEVETHNKR